MISFLNNPLTLGVLVGSIICLFVVQIIILLRIKNVLQQISIYIESVSRFFFRLGMKQTQSAVKKTIPQTCQFCKHRLSFIHMSENKGEVEDFYYKCRLRNIEVQLNDTCEKFIKDDNYVV